VIEESQRYRLKLANLLDEFYQGRKVSNDTRLGFFKVGYGFRFQSIGAEAFETQPTVEN